MFCFLYKSLTSIRTDQSQESRLRSHMRRSGGVIVDILLCSIDL